MRLIRDVDHITDEFRECLSDHESLFTVSSQDVEGGDVEVTIKYEWGGRQRIYYYYARIDKNYEVEFCAYEDTYYRLDEGSLFKDMWFKEMEDA